jgi:L-rhamnose mutarotase
MKNSPHFDNDVRLYLTGAINVNELYKTTKPVQPKTINDILKEKKFKKELPARLEFLLTKYRIKQAIPKWCIDNWVNYPCLINGALKLGLFNKKIMHQITSQIDKHNEENEKIYIDRKIFNFFSEELYCNFDIEYNNIPEEAREMEWFDWLPKALLDYLHKNPEGNFKNLETWSREEIVQRWITGIKMFQKAYERQNPKGGDTWSSKLFKKQQQQPLQPQKKAQGQKNKPKQPQKRVNTQQNGCMDCGKEFGNSQSLIQHMNDVHGVVIQKQQTTQNTKCRICQKDFNSNQSLKQHLEMAHNIGVSQKSVGPQRIRGGQKKQESQGFRKNQKNSNMVQQEPKPTRGNQPRKNSGYPDKKFNKKPIQSGGKPNTLNPKQRGGNNFQSSQGGRTIKSGQQNFTVAEVQSILAKIKKPFILLGGYSYRRADLAEQLKDRNITVLSKGRKAGINRPTAPPNRN